METPQQIIAETKELGNKLKLVEEKIASKLTEAEDLKKRNAKLMSLHLGKQRMPASVGIQREQVKSINIECEELEYLKKDLTNKIEEKKKDLEMANLAKRVIEFKQANQDYFHLFDYVMLSLTEFNIQVGHLFNQMREGVHPLARLRDLTVDLNRKKINLDIFDLDLRALIGRYVSTINEFSEVKELGKAIDEIIYQTRSYSNQANSTIRGSKSYPKHQPKKGNVPLTDFEKRLAFFQEAVKADNIRTGKADFQPKILKPVKYIQDAPVKIDGSKVPDQSPPDFVQNEFEKEPEENFPDKEVLKEISDGIIEKEIKKVN